MRNPIHVLKSLEEKASVSNNKYERLYRNLYNPEFYLLAYANIAKSQGSMTQGVDGQTLDNMSLPRINRIIESIRNRTYQPKPAKRKYIPKSLLRVLQEKIGIEGEFTFRKTLGDAQLEFNVGVSRRRLVADRDTANKIIVLE